jgi:pimeloyl-ACP methyl ester carboxylesterase
VGEHVRVGELDIWTEQVGEGPEVLLIGGLGDTVESWQLQLDGLSDRYRLTAFDNRGAGRTALPDAPLSGATMADDAALLQIAPPTLVLSGELDIIMPPRVGRSVAAVIPNARFEVIPGEAHQPFQEVPDEFNARVDVFWREVEAAG